MADLVVDSSVWVASFLSNDEHRQQAELFVNELEADLHRCHLPYLVLVETCAVITRQVQTGRTPFVRRAQRSFERWTQQGLISWYALDEPRARATVDLNLTLPLPLKGSDSVIVSLAQELGYPVMTYDGEIRQRYRNVTP
jgi:predicted nucleic acid-binding protein